MLGMTSRTTRRQSDVLYGASSGAVVELELAHYRGARDTSGNRREEDPEDQNQTREARSESGDGDKREHEKRHRHESVGEPHQRSVDDSEAHGRNASPRHSHYHCQACRERHDDQVEAPTVQSSTQEIATELVGPEEMLSARTFQNVEGVEGIRSLRGDERRRE